MLCVEIQPGRFAFNNFRTSSPARSASVRHADLLRMASVTEAQSVGTR